MFTNCCLSQICVLCRFTTLQRRVRTATYALALQPFKEQSYRHASLLDRFMMFAYISQLGSFMMSAYISQVGCLQWFLHEV